MESKLTYPENVIPPLRFQFCPMCTTPLTREVVFDDNIPRVKCSSCGWIQLSTNAVGVIVIATNEQGIVAILHPNEDGVSTPAGLVEYGESPETAAIREVYEETGLNVVIVDYLGWYFSNQTTWPGPVIQMMYEASVVGGKLRGSDEGEVKIFPHGEFPAISSSRTGSQRARQVYLSKVDKVRMNPL
jgi:8-oxo-dGTP pyrophosphatase MutT (NUDIX family)